MTIRPRLSLVIPCYNEAESISGLVERSLQVVETVFAEVIFVDNGSTDTTKRELGKLKKRHPAFRVVHVRENVGYGHGIVAGLEQASGEILAWTHADLQTNPSDVLRGMKFFEESSSQIFVKGRRSGRPFFDQFFTSGMSFFESALLRVPLVDINAQPTMFRRDFFETWSSPPHDFSLDLYAYYWARKQGIDVRRFPVRFAPRPFGESHWNTTWRSRYRFIRRTIDFSLRLRKQVNG